MNLIKCLVVKSGLQPREYMVLSREAVEDMKDQLDQKIARRDNQVPYNFDADIPVGKMIKTELVDGDELELYVYIETDKENEI